jgi:DNA-binding NarL/FixJ family response regulator/Tfp pilus assembly protein PilF
MADYSNLSVLIVDPNQSMRASLHNMLTQVNITKVDHAVSSATAIRQLGTKSYDVILCEYDLGGSADNAGQDGQQLLEDLRHHRVISQWAIFFMLTSEGAYGKVVSAAELLPTDYLLKPFTVDVLSQRIGRALERRSTFLPVYQMIGQGKAREAIDACLQAEAAQSRYSMDYARLRAELLVNLERYAEGERAYAGIVQIKPLGWAQLGQARCVYHLRRLPEARAMLEELLAGNPKFMAAYDLLARTLRELQLDDAAKKVLEDAVAISPHMVRRLRNLGDVALATGDVDAAEKAYKQVVAKAKYSEFRDPADHVSLVRTLVQKGDAAGASSVIRDLERSMRSSPTTDVCKSYAAAMVMELKGDTAGATAELAKAMAKLGEATGMSSNIKLGLAHSCLNNRMDEQATQLFDELTADPNSGVDEAQVLALCAQAERPDMGKKMASRLEAEVDALVRQAAAKSREGDLRGAVEVLQTALERSPDHTGLWSAAATAMLRQLGELGWDAALVAQCTGLMRRIREHNPEHPLLPGLIAQYSAIRQKYAAAAAAATAAATAANTPPPPPPAPAAAESR